ncbi:MOSC and FAD-binding oxidoreductase domain-containing protein [Conexibacter woesei]|uniref:MOSC and FAD-binding oxidoreductase domain-containing protein n=1 Tax=Conexibacter woesei TaxID=191495 RepID=UPI00041129A3|nr:MOSC and FAD-binding oxidoreductase domain-containing protein [Conexibacter woesei]
MSDGRLLSVNVGLPRDIAWEGETVRTAIWKEPVDGPRMVRRINVDGDDQADRKGHGGEHRAVFVYQIEAYNYWQEQLGRDDFTYGQFGENFTIEGSAFADDAVCIGDRWRIGKALFEVTQPRVTCFRLGIRMNVPEMAALVVAHHRPGFYLRVIEEGEVQAGDIINKVADGPERLTVADVDALLYLPHRSREKLQRALRIPALSEGWKGSFRDLLAGAVGAATSTPATPPAWAGFAPLKVTATTRESDTIMSFTFAGDAPDARAGQYLTVRVRPDGPDGPALVRSYSLSAPPGASTGTLRISVKRDGVVSRYLHDHVRPGDTIDVAAPRGVFTLRTDAPERPIVLLSAGVGATPVLAMLAQLAHDQTTRPVWWVHGARNARERAFAQETMDLLTRLPAAHHLIAYSAPETTTQGNGYDITGHLDGQALERAQVPLDADFYLCGPAPFMKALSAALVARGVTPDRIATETFGDIAVSRTGIVEGVHHPPHAPDGPPGTGPLVTFARSGVSVPYDADRFPNLLELAEACEVPMPYSCRTGVCHTCATGVLDGDVSYRPEPLERPEAGVVLPCCARPTTPITLDV